MAEREGLLGTSEPSPLRGRRQAGVLRRFRGLSNQPIDYLGFEPCKEININLAVVAVYCELVSVDSLL